jgi:hypothetical protein
MAAYSGGFTGYVSASPPWCDTASPNVEHYGMKMLLEAYNTGAYASYVVFKLEYTYHIELRDVK